MSLRSKGPALGSGVKRAALAGAALAAVGALVSAPDASAAPSGSNSNAASYQAASPSPEYDYAVAATPPSSGLTCVSASGAKACFQKYGDKIWILDTSGTTYAAVAPWENYLWNGSSWQLYRTGNCYNRLGKGVWGVCNKDFYEDSSTNAYGSTGSGLRLWAENLDWSDYIWIRNNG
jgi:hypothetical protein